MNHNYFVYILTNYNKTVLYTGVTNNINYRLEEHKSGLHHGFTKRYKCYYLLYYEHFTDINHAIEREKEIKGWLRVKKEKLINTKNPNWNFLNDEISEL